MLEQSEAKLPTPDDRSIKNHGKDNYAMVSVIVPIYNANEFLCECIDSIINQTYPNIEIILVDDGSTDGSSKICDEYADKESRIHVIHKANGGRNAARLDGFQNSHGEWIMFVDADDVLLVNSVEALISRSNGYDIVRGQALVYNGDLTEARAFPSHIIKNYDWSPKEFISNLILGKCLISIWGMIIRRNVLTSGILTLPRDLNFSEDLLLNIRLGLNAKRILGIDDIVYYYRYYEGNTVYNYKVKLSYIEKIVNIIETDLKSDNCDSLFSEELFRYKLQKIITHFFDNYQSSDTYKSIKKDKGKYKLSLREKYFLTISKIPSIKVVKFLWNAFNSAAKTIR